MELQKHSLLYVDDEKVNLELFFLSFRRDFEIYLANSAKEGLIFLEKNKVDVIITDQKMPEMTGVEFLCEINRRFPDIPPCRLMISGYTRNEDIESAFNNYKLFEFISKPWNAIQLKKTILTAIEKCHG
ncbi:MAG: two-component system response regulator [Bacteroidetes bacterium GWA2_31_9b]|nr:MAG: two-component system response regulator [Bacteroidetes bacterium GWA2_31_9b]